MKCEKIRCRSDRECTITIRSAYKKLSKREEKRKNEYRKEKGNENENENGSNEQPK